MANLPESKPAETDWFQDELMGLFTRLIQSVAAVVGATESEVDLLSVSGLEDTFIERSTRDVKAHGFDLVVALLDEIVENEHI